MSRILKPTLNCLNARHLAARFKAAAQDYPATLNHLASGWSG
jgi:hypothetical protein